MTEYLPPVKQDFEADVSGYIKSVDKAEARLDEYGKKSDQVTGKVKKNQDEQGKAVSDFERLLGSKLKNGETGLQSLQREMDKTKTKVADLRKEAGKTGSESLFGDLKKSEADLKKLEGIFKDITGVAAPSGKAAGDGFMSGLSSTLTDFTTTGVAIKAGLIGAAVIAAPAVAGILNGAILTGLGLGGFAVGFAEAIHDPRVHGVLDQLESQIGSTFKQATSGFTQPVYDGLAYLSAVFARAEPGLQSTFDTLAQAAGPLIQGFGDFIEQVLPGLESGIKDAEPLVATLAQYLPDLGKAIGYMFKSFGQGADGAKLGLMSIIGVIGGAAEAIGWLTREGSHLFVTLMSGFGDVLDVIGSVVDGIEKVAKYTPFLGDGIKGLGSDIHGAADKVHAFVQASKDAGDTTGYANGQMKNYAGSTKDAKQALQDLVDATNTWINAAQGSDDALLAMKTAESDFSEGLVKGKKNWDENTRAGQKNVALLNRYNESITSRYDKMAALHPLTQTQVKDELALEQKLYDNAKAAGASDDELATLAGTIARLKSELEKLNGTTAKYYVKGIETHTAGGSGPVAGPGSAHATFSQGGFVKAAAQGLVAGILAPQAGGTIFQAGEMQTRGEVMTPLAGISPQRAMNLSQVVGDAYGFDVAPRGRMAAFAGGGGGGTQTVIPTIVVELGGKQMAVVHGGLMQYSQRFKKRTGTTGLT